MWKMVAAVALAIGALTALGLASNDRDEIAEIRQTTQEVRVVLTSPVALPSALGPFFSVGVL